MCVCVCVYLFFTLTEYYTRLTKQSPWSVEEKDKKKLKRGHNQKSKTKKTATTQRIRSTIGEEAQKHTGKRRRLVKRRSRAHSMTPPEPQLYHTTQYYSIDSNN